MKAKTSLVTFAALGLITATPITTAAETWETHNTWATTCRPFDGEPFYVTADSYVGGSIDIYGRGGRPWRNEITDSTNLTDSRSFGVEGRGLDVHGRMRTITMVFAPDRTLLAVNHDANHEIICDNAHGVSND
jgi:hypothetical protein